MVKGKFILETRLTMPEVIILFQGDPWLMRDSLRIVGVFSDEDNFKKFADELCRAGTISLAGYHRLIGENARQCEIEGGALVVEKYDLNPKLEDTDL